MVRFIHEGSLSQLVVLSLRVPVCQLVSILNNPVIQGRYPGGAITIVPFFVAFVRCIVGKTHTYNCNSREHFVSHRQEPQNVIAGR